MIILCERVQCYVYVYLCTSAASNIYLEGRA